MRRIQTKNKKKNISLFSQQSLVILISIVTLLLQLISFATTWDGAGIYLEGVFPYASLCFAIAIQATAYFFSNSLRNRVSILKVVALGTALCCSTYYSYIGIYNSVNSPVIYLQESYIRISQEMTEQYDEALASTLAAAQKAVNDASSQIISHYTALTGVADNIANCEAALNGITTDYATDMRAPKQSSYETYEEYAAAYQAYIYTLSQGKNTELEAGRQSTLSSYGFSSIDSLNTARQDNVASINALQTALCITGDISVSETLSAMTIALSLAINETANGQALDNTDITQLNRLFRAAGLCGYQYEDLSQMTSALNQCAQVASGSLLKEYNELTEALPGKTVTDENTMELKASMDAEIMTALIKLNTLLSTEKQLSYTDSAYSIMDLYLIPIKALQSPDTRMTALFCLAVAALIDMLSVLFAISLRDRKPLWKRHTLLFNRMEEYEPLIYASLPGAESPSRSLADFLSCFQASPQTEGDGYMLCSSMQSLSGFHALAALLCQINLAKIVPAGFSDNEEDTLLLKARFIFWANTMIYEEKAYE